MKNLLDKIAVAILIPAVFFLLLEITSELILPRLKINHGHVELGVAGRYVLEYPQGYLKDRELFWRLEPGCGEYNSLGFRDKEFIAEKTAGSIRIICMGDSVTFGWPAGVDNTYPKILGKLLQDKFPNKKFEVLNFGVPGYTSYQGLILLQKYAIRYAPDLVIVYYGVNDRAGCYKPDKYQRATPSLVVNIENFLRRFAFYRLALGFTLSLKYPPQRDSLLINHRVSSQDYRENLQAIAQAARQHGIQSLFIVNPAFYDPQKMLVLGDDAYSSPQGTDQFDIYKFFKKREKEAEGLFLDDVRPLNFHLTARGHDLLALGIFDEVARILALSGIYETEKEE